MATARTSVMRAFDTQADLKDHREHCAPAARTLVSPRQRASPAGEDPSQRRVRALHGERVAARDDRLGRADGSRRPPAPRRGGGVRGRAGHEGRCSRSVRQGRQRCRRADRAAEQRWLPNAPHHRRPRRWRHRGAHRRASRAGRRPSRSAAGQRVAGQWLGVERRRLRSLAHHLRGPQPGLLPPAQLADVPALRPCRRVPRLRR
jgi:hypothetical protein